MYEEAIDVDRQIMLSGGVPQAEADQRSSEVRNAYRASGAKGFWQMVLDRRSDEARSGGQETDPYVLAGLQLGTGNREQALDSLEKAVAMGPAKTSILWLKAEPVWDPLRDEPRFKEILRKMGLPE
jgi:hypothetical protein